MSQLIHKGMAVRAKEAGTPSEAGIPVQGTVIEGGTHQGSPEHSLIELPEGHGAQGSMPVLQLTVFTYSVENTSLSIWFHKDFVCLEKS